jgi:hypothetical protein
MEQARVRGQESGAHFASVQNEFIRVHAWYQVDVPHLFGRDLEQSSTKCGMYVKTSSSLEEYQNKLRIGCWEKEHSASAFAILVNDEHTKLSLPLFFATDGQCLNRPGNATFLLQIAQDSAQSQLETSQRDFALLQFEMGLLHQRMVEAQRKMTLHSSFVATLQSVMDGSAGKQPKAQ